MKIQMHQPGARYTVNNKDNKGGSYVTTRDPIAVPAFVVCMREETMNGKILPESFVAMQEE